MTQNFMTIDTKLSAQILRTAIKNSGYSVAELQEMLYLACPQPIYRWMNGNTLPSIDNLYRLSQILNTSMENLLAFKQVSIVDKKVSVYTDTNNNQKVMSVYTDIRGGKK